MGPDKNPELFEAAFAGRVVALEEEFMRRNVLAGTIADLSAQFAQREFTSCPVTEPTLFARMFALALLQRSSLGISGFNPMHSIKDQFENPTVSAKAAPHHDEKEINGSRYRTRVIMFEPGNVESSGDIEIFGINFYQPDHLIGNLPDGQDSSLVLISGIGKVIERDDSISGETSLFAVHNRKTNDSKIYHISFTNEVPQDMMQPIMILPDGNSAVLRLPDSQVVQIRQLNGEILNQAVDELVQSTARYKSQTDQNLLLSAQEREAVRAVIR